MEIYRKHHPWLIAGIFTLLCTIFLQGKVAAQVVETPSELGDKEFPKIHTPNVGKVSDFYINQIVPTVAFDASLAEHPERPPIPEIKTMDPQLQFGGVSFGDATITGVTETMPGLMGIERGAISISHTFGNLTLQGSLNAEKYGYYNGTFTTYGISGAAIYRFNKSLAMTLFGSFYTRNLYVTAAMMPYIAANNFGGYLTIQFDDHWGVDVGARAVYNSMSRRYDVLPIGAPFYKVGDAKIQVDVGGILYEILRTRTKQNPGGATIGPPMQDMFQPVIPPHD